MNKAMLNLIMLGLLVGCGGEAPSESEIKAEFEVAVELARECETDQQCVIVSPGCPLGCSVAVNSEKQENITNLASKLISEHQRGGAGCAYSCMATRAVCTDNLCESVPF